jgi:membrane protease YdiL (CAAX protease family)
MHTLITRIRIICLAGLAAFAITAIGQTLWGVLAIVDARLTPAFPWAAVVMPAILAALALFLSGRIGPRRSAAARAALVPAAPVSAEAWAWSLVAGACAVVAAAALWTVMATLVRVPPNLLPDTHGLPIWTVVPMLLVAIAAAPLTEELAFRGYAMGMISREFRPVPALVITSVLFAAVHLTQGLCAPKLIVYLLAGLTFGYVALRTGSLLPAMVVHSFGDLTFFTLVWSHDAGRRLVSEGGADAWFYANVAMLAVFSPLSLLAFRQLTRVTGGRARFSRPGRWRSPEAPHPGRSRADSLTYYRALSVSGRGRAIASKRLDLV